MNEKEIANLIDGTIIIVIVMIVIALPYCCCQVSNEEYRKITTKMEQIKK